MRIFALVAALVGFSACTTFEDIDGGLDAFKGRSIDDLISVMGSPDGQQSIAGHNLIIWHSSQNITTIHPVTTYNSGTANIFGNIGYSYGSYNSSSTTYVPSTVNYNCTIKVEIDRENRIIGHEFEGNIGGCERHAASLRPYLESGA